MNDEVEEGGKPHRTKHAFSVEFETIGDIIPSILCEEEDNEKHPVGKGE